MGSKPTSLRAAREPFRGSGSPTARRRAHELFLRLAELYESRFALVLLLVIVGATALAWSNRFVQDDAFISFRYARNLVEGHGLIWNPGEGERVEGYTNFLWTLLMSVPVLVAWDPVRFSFAVSLSFFALTLLVTFKLARMILDSRHLAMLTVLLLGANYTFLAYGTGGLETQSQAFFFVLATYLCLRSEATGDWSPRATAMLSLVLSAALLTRLDSALLVLVIVPLAVASILKRVPRRKARLAAFSGLIVPAMILIGGWFVWKLFYYGDILPNTFYAKARGNPVYGAYFLTRFLSSYWLVPFPFLLLAGLPRLRREQDLRIAALLTVVVIWCFYMIRIGGGFMEFRLLVPILPLFFVLVTWTLASFDFGAAVKGALVALIVLGSIHHAVTFGRFTFTPSLNSVDVLRERVAEDNPMSWVHIGKTLGRAFGQDPQVRIATGAAGAIPFYSRLTTVDIFGMSDQWVVQHGRYVGETPGHRREATYEYLVERGVHLVPGPLEWRPEAWREGMSVQEFNSRFAPYLLRREELPPGALIFSMPMDSDPNMSLMVLYLSRSPIVDSAIRQNGWTLYPVFPAS